MLETCIKIVYRNKLMLLLGFNEVHKPFWFIQLKTVDVFDVLGAD